MHNWNTIKSSIVFSFYDCINDIITWTWYVSTCHRKKEGRSGGIQRTECVWLRSRGVWTSLKLNTQVHLRYSVLYRCCVKRLFFSYCISSTINSNLKNSLLALFDHLCMYR